MHLQGEGAQALRVRGEGGDRDDEQEQLRGGGHGAAGEPLRRAHAPGEPRSGPAADGAAGAGGVRGPGIQGPRGEGGGGVHQRTEAGREDRARQEVHPQAAGGGAGDRAPEVGRPDGKELAEGHRGRPGERPSELRGAQHEIDTAEAQGDSLRLVSGTAEMATY